MPHLFFLAASQVPITCIQNHYYYNLFTTSQYKILGGWGGELLLGGEDPRAPPPPLCMKPCIIKVGRGELGVVETLGTNSLYTDE